jgi:hypothetical protein
MVINFNAHWKLGEGVYSGVYEVEGRAFKLFKRYPQFPPRQTEEGRRLTFQHQCQAYERASSGTFLKNHIATYYGQFIIDDVVGADGSSLKESYLLDCCYIMEVMGGSETKTASALRLAEIERFPHIKEAADRFAGIGIEYRDSSVFGVDDPEHFKFIDFELPYY